MELKYLGLVPHFKEGAQVILLQILLISILGTKTHTNYFLSFFLFLSFFNLILLGLSCGRWAT